MAVILVASAGLALVSFLALRGRESERDRHVRNTYTTAHMVCAHDPEQIYKEQGTREARAAARGYADRVSEEGPHREASERGCLDGLEGKKVAP